MAVNGKHIQRPSRRERRSKRLIILLLVVAVAAVGIAVWAVSFRGQDEQITDLTPDYAPQQEENVESMGDEGDEKLEAAEGGGAVSLTYSVDVSVSLSEETVSLYFGNPSRSTENIVLQLMIQDTVIMQSGLIEPGSQVSTLSLLAGAAEHLEPGGYDGKFVVLYYDPETGARAIVTTEIPVTVTVTE